MRRIIFICGILFDLFMFFGDIVFVIKEITKKYRDYTEDDQSLA